MSERRSRFRRSGFASFSAGERTSVPAGIGAAAPSLPAEADPAATPDSPPSPVSALVVAGPSLPAPPERSRPGELPKAMPAVLPLLS
eukprot:scaffold262702_cov30-Tisochrysis_lutea.AAC.2